ncbi:Coenzyme F420 hydrogenase/dehydrogenase, beta subunit C-terminal domain [Falsigemmobacter faecalis]|uniref:Coenzyme F420 hydrogenase n=1 Tax=Falsigemmobacter faecalis TaxID=2488730 RepID=A0A3P3DXV3_9RHOB|nr:Coenzyme F420 hydrogenase/dehydrogenase, beta subunit C-terminal domain [Falsigemmobacter faecalis]RRH78272.1 coenzyme F420 hydrogenase [Falsigemmobacter faecalis]
MKTVLDLAEAGFCTGCGICAFRAPDALKMALSEEGQFRPQRRGAGDSDALPPAAQCPMSGEGPDETAIAARLWPELPADPQIGRHLTTAAVHLTDDPARLSSGSGGLVSWLAAELLARKTVDCVLHVRPQSAQADPADPLFSYRVSRRRDEISEGKKSRYYPVEMSRVLADLAASQERAAIIALPCFIKGLRGAIRDGALAPERAPVLIGLVCGHLKSARFADYLAWQRDVPPGGLGGCDFRHKLTDRPASEYGFALRRRGAPPGTAPEVVPMRALNGHDWGEGLFRLPACEFCDDVLAECADVAIGDAWLPEFVQDPRGENIVVTRSPALAALIEEGRLRGDLAVTPLTPERVAQSQAGGLRHRREGLAHRLAKRKAQSAWLPRRRVVPSLAPDRARRAIYDLRHEIALACHPAFRAARASGNIGQFEAELAPLLRRLRRQTHGPLMRRVLRRLRRLALSLWRKAG